VSLLFQATYSVQHYSYEQRGLDPKSSHVPTISNLSIYWMQRNRVGLQRAVISPYTAGNHAKHGSL